MELVPQNFWLLALTLLPHWCKISSSSLVPVLKYWTWTKGTPHEKWFFWSNPYKIQVMITSLYRNARVIKLWSHDHTYNIIWITWHSFDGDVIDRNYDVISFFSKHLYFAKTWGSHFADIIKIGTILNKTMFKDLRKVKRIRNYV